MTKTVHIAETYHKKLVREAKKLKVSIKGLLNKIVKEHFTK